MSAASIPKDPFTQEDPIGIAGGLNLYGYAGGDPINFSDPFGLCKEEDATCWRLVRALEGVGGKTFDDAAKRLAGYQGDVSVFEDTPFGATTNARRMQLFMGAAREGEGSSDIQPRAGDLLLLLVHETFHLNPDGSYSRSNPHDTRTQKASFDRRELNAFFEMDPVTMPAPLYLARYRRWGGLTPPPSGRE